MSSVTRVNLGKIQDVTVYIHRLASQININLLTKESWIMSSTYDC